MTEVIPVSMGLQASTIQAVRELQPILQAKSEADVIKTSVALMELIANQITKYGGQVVLENKYGAKQSIIISGLTK